MLFLGPLPYILLQFKPVFLRKDGSESTHHQNAVPRVRHNVSDVLYLTCFSPIEPNGLHWLWSPFSHLFEELPRGGGCRGGISFSSGLESSYRFPCWVLLIRLQWPLTSGCQLLVAHLAHSCCPMCTESCWGTTWLILDKQVPSDTVRISIGTS